MACAAWVAAFLLPCLAYAQAGVTGPPAWAIEVPGAAGARWGIGLGFRTSESDGLEGRGGKTSLLLDSQSEEERSALDLDLDLDLDLVGVQVPISLGSFGPSGPYRALLYPSLVLEGGAATAETDRQPYYGASLGLAATLGDRRGWFAEGRLGYLRVPDLEVSGAAPRSPELADDLALFAPPRREGELTDERWTLSARLGRSFAGGRVAPYVGLRATSREVDVETTARIPRERRFGDQFPNGRFVEQIELAADDHIASGVAGIDASLCTRVFVRAQATFGDETGVLVKAVVPLFRGRRPAPPVLSDPPERARELALAIAPRLRDALEALEAARADLEGVTGPGGVRSYRSEDLGDLLVEAEARLETALAGTGSLPVELAPLRDYFERETDRVREDLSCACGAAAAPAVALSAARRPVTVRTSSGPPRVPAAAARVRPAQGPVDDETVPKAEADSALDRFLAAVRYVLARAEADDLRVAVCVRVAPRRTDVTLCPYLGPPETCRRATVEEPLLVKKILGLYALRVGESPAVSCRPWEGEEDAPCPLDLVDDPKPILDCDLTGADPSCASLDGTAEPCR